MFRKKKSVDSRVEAYIIRLHPDQEQHKILISISRDCTHLHNRLVEYVRNTHSVTDLNDILQVSRQFNTSYGLHSQVVQDVATRVMQSYSKNEQNNRAVEHVNKIIDLIHEDIDGGKVAEHDKGLRTDKYIEVYKTLNNIKYLDPVVYDRMRILLQNGYSRYVKRNLHSIPFAKSHPLKFISTKTLSSVTWNQYANSWSIDLHNSMVTLSRGRLYKRLHIPISTSLYITGSLKTINVSYKLTGRKWKWIAHITTELLKEPVVLYEGRKPLGAGDLGLANVIGLSDGVVMHGVDFYRRMEDRIRSVQTKISTIKKGYILQYRHYAHSHRHGPRIRLRVFMRHALTHHAVYLRLRKKLQLLHRKAYNRRDDFIKKLAHFIDKRYNIFCIEWHSLQFLYRNSHLSKTSYDRAIAMLRDRIVQKLGLERIMKISAYGNSQSCICGAAVSKELSDRVHDCHECGVRTDRDVMAALMTMLKGLRILSDEDIQDHKGRQQHGDLTYKHGKHKVRLDSTDLEQCQRSFIQQAYTAHLGHIQVVNPGTWRISPSV